MISIEEAQRIGALYDVSPEMAKAACEFCRLQEAERPAAILSAAGRIRSALRATRTGGKSGGRPPGPQCACGAMTAYQARKKRHVCLYDEYTPCPERI